MSSTTMGVRLDEETRNRLKDAAQKLDRTSHWLIKQAIFNYLEQIENDQLTLTPITQAEQDIEESTAPNGTLSTVFRICRADPPTIGVTLGNYFCLSYT